MKENYKLYWWRGNEHNFGDEITPWLFNKMCGISQSSPCNIKLEKGSILLAVGSIMRLSSPKTIVWGSGIRNVDQSDFTRAKKYCAVRGPFSQRQLKKLGFDCPEVYGDPGLLLPKYYLPKIKKKFKLGIIPHVSEYTDLKKIYSKIPGVNVISLKTNKIERVIDEIVSCESTVSSSLHGIITSVAYNIPTRWLKYSDRITGDDIKFYDFFASIDPAVIRTFDFSQKKSTIEKYNPLFYSSTLTTNDMIQNTHLYDTSKLNLQALLDACPIKVINSK